jgi:hypothetical protein
MRYLASLSLFLFLTPSCAVQGDDDGATDPGGGYRGGPACKDPEAISTPQELRNPETLVCESYGGTPCDPSCGPCPEVVAEPTWGVCGSPCDELAENDCERNVACRVVKDAVCAVSGHCVSDYVGCFPTDRVPDGSIDCFAARDGKTCSQSPHCTAFHRGTWRGLQGAVTRPFAMCAPENASPGTCFGPVTCGQPAPACPDETAPGIANGCYTGACIPKDICERRPD